MKQIRRCLKGRSLLLMMIFSIALAMACADEEAPQADGVDGHEHQDVHDHGRIFLEEADRLYDRLSRASNSGFSTDPIDLSGRDFDRVGMRFDADQRPEVELRISVDDGTSWSDWKPVTITYQDGAAYNAHADVTGPATDLEIRFHELERRELRFLVVEAFDFKGDREDAIDLSSRPDRPAEMSSIDQVHQGLAANTGVDVTRAQWGAVPDSCSATHSPYRMTVHHTATPTNDSNTVEGRVQQIQDYDMVTRGFCDIGYHFLVGQDGQVYQGRLEGTRGAHVLNHNVGNLGVAFIGNYNETPPSTAMFEAGGQILAAISGFYNIDLYGPNVYGHQDLGPTACPGYAFYDQLDHLKDVASGSSSGGGGVDEQGCTSTEADNCAAYGCACVDGECSGGYCEGSGCSAQKEADCAAFGCGCVDGECAGGYCDGSGCTEKQKDDCAAYGCGCANGECSGGYCDGTGCTEKQENDCAAFGCSCVDGACSGGYCDGSGCTIKQTNDCAAYECGCVDGECSGGECDGTGCTAKQESHCDDVGCACANGECEGEVCEDTGCDSGQLDCGNGICVGGDGCCHYTDCGDGEVCVDHACEPAGELHANMEVSTPGVVYPNVPEDNSPGTAVNASDTSIGDVESRQWTIEDGDPDASSEAEVSFRFQSPGSHQVTLEVCTNGGALCDQTSQPVEVHDPAPTLGTLTADPDSVVACLPVTFQVEGVNGYPIPELFLEIVDDATDELVASGAEVASGVWDTTGVEPGSYYARMTATNESGQATVESEPVEVMAPGDGDVPSECDEGGGHEPQPDAGGHLDDAGTGGTEPDGGDGDADVGIPDPGTVDTGESEQDDQLPSESCGGCSASGGGGTDTALWLVLTLGLVALRGRYRRCTASRNASKLSA